MPINQLSLQSNIISGDQKSFRDARKSTKLLEILLTSDTQSHMKLYFFDYTVMSNTLQ